MQLLQQFLWEQINISDRVMDIKVEIKDFKDERNITIFYQDARQR